MFYQSKYKELKINMRSGYTEVVNGTPIFHPGELIVFQQYRFTPKSKEVEELMDAMLRNGNEDFYKITDEEIELAKEEAVELANLEEKYAKKKAKLDRLAVPKDGKTLVRGASSSEGEVSGGKKVNIPEGKPKSPKEKKYPEGEADIAGKNGEVGPGTVVDPKGDDDIDLSEYTKNLGEIQGEEPKPTDEFQEK